MKKCMERLEALQELGGIRKDVTLLAISGVAVICSLCGVASVRLTRLGWQLSCAACRSCWKRSSGL